MKKISFLYLAALYVFLSLNSFAQNNPEKVDQTKKPMRISVMKEVQGEITWISKKYVALVYNRNDQTRSEDEILLPLDKDLKLEHRKSLSEFSPGDTVSVQYEETTEDTPDGAVTSRVAKKLIFIRKAQPKPDKSGILESSPVLGE